MVTSPILLSVTIISKVLSLTDISMLYFPGGSGVYCRIDLLNLDLLFIIFFFSFNYRIVTLS